jgi:hypothetical protein
MAAALAALDEAEQTGQGLDIRARLFDSLRAHARRYLPLAVHQARLAGAQWEDVAVSTGVTKATARGRWSEVRITEMLSVPVQQVPPVGVRRRSRPPGRALTRPLIDARQRLADALDFLLRVSGRELPDLAQATALPEGVLAGLLSGAVLPAWPEVALLAACLGADPGEVRLLWQWAAGEEVSPATPAEAGRFFRQAVRGLYLAAGCPPAPVIAEQAGPGITADLVTEVLRGRTRTSWDRVAGVLEVLGADAAPVRALWLTARGMTEPDRPVRRRGDALREGTRRRGRGVQ